MTASNPFVYLFSASRTDGAAAMKNLLGGKGANLAEMCRLGIPVPPGFTITTEACTVYTREGTDAVRALIETGARKEVAMMVPVVFLLLPLTIVFAFYPGLAGLHLVAP